MSQIIRQRGNALSAGASHFSERANTSKGTAGTEPVSLGIGNCPTFTWGKTKSVCTPLSPRSPNRSGINLLCCMETKRSLKCCCNVCSWLSLQVPTIPKTSCMLAACGVMTPSCGPNGTLLLVPHPRHMLGFWLPRGMLGFAPPRHRVRTAKVLTSTRSQTWCPWHPLSSKPTRSTRVGALLLLRYPRGHCRETLLLKHPWLQTWIHTCS